MSAEHTCERATEEAPPWNSSPSHGVSAGVYSDSCREDAVAEPAEGLSKAFLHHRAHHSLALLHVLHLVSVHMVHAVAQIDETGHGCTNAKHWAHAEA